MSNKKRLKQHKNESQAVLEDIRFFQANPIAKAYERPATEAELRQYSLPPGSLCAVVKLGPAMHARMFRPSQPAGVN